jgi:hypothetical protein
MRWLTHSEDPFEEEKAPWYDVAQICLNGHTINSSSKSSPECCQDFCAKCGSKTITACPGCKVEIRGYYHVQGVIGFYEFTPPRFCHNCGKAYPWTDLSLQAAKKYALELQELSEAERVQLAASLEDLLRDNPMTPVAVSRFKRLVAKAGKGAADTFKSLLVDVISQVAKKSIWPS